MATPEMLRPEDVEEAELARVDVFAHEVFGRDEKRWTPRQLDDYFAALDTVHRVHHSREVAS